jgi:5-methylcytosine-specific restriction endonuclease McrA
MPIKPENAARYPADWKQIRQRILARAENKCENCGAHNHRLHPETGAFVVLTIAHLDHTPEHSEDSNLRAWCQRCHNRYDRAHRNQTRIETRDHALVAAGQLDLITNTR